MLRHCGRPTGLEDHRVASRVTASERSRAARVSRSRHCDRGAAPVARGDVPEALRGYLLVGRAATAEAVELARSCMPRMRARPNSSASEAAPRQLEVVGGTLCGGPARGPGGRSPLRPSRGARRAHVEMTAFRRFGAVEGGRGTFCEIGWKMDRPWALSCAPCALTRSSFALSG